MSAGVRNLRAMFENKSTDQSVSPPSRGRSPSGSIASNGSRPVSKVRASFVAVERPGDSSQGPQWGLRKASDVSSMAEVKDNEGAVSQSTSVEQGRAPLSSHSAKHSIDGGLGSILKGSSFEGTPIKENPKPALQEVPKTNGVASRAAAMVEKMKTKEKPPPPPTTTLKTTPTAQPIKPPHPKHISAKQSPVSPKVQSPKTPTSPAATKMNIKGGPAKIRGVMESAKKASEIREALRKEQAAKPANAPAKSDVPRMPSSATTVPSNVTASTEVSDGHKTSVKAESKPAPKPKSLVTPAKLPSAVTATTASAAARTDSQLAAQKKTISRPSMTSRPPKATLAATASTASTLAKKSSRASLVEGDRPKSRLSSSGKPDESFLARMARPTVSSASKTHDKTVVNSPPRGKPKTKTAPRVSFASRPRKSDQSQAHSERENITEEAEAEAKLAVSPTATTEATREESGPGFEKGKVPQQTDIAGQTNGISSAESVESNA